MQCTRAPVAACRFTAYRALFHTCRARPGEWILVHGASGGVGIPAVQMAVDAGMNVIGTAGKFAVRETSGHGVQYMCNVLRCVRVRAHG